MIRIVFACQRRRGRRTRVLGRGFILDHQLDLAVADAALRIVALDRPLPMTLMRRASRLPIDWMEQRTLYIVSGQGSGEVKLKVGSDRGWIAPNQVNAIPTNGPIVFRAEFTPTPAREFFDRWKTFRIAVKHDGGAILTKDVDENMVAAIYAGFRPNPIGPQITAKA
jgi:hypothetical protein